MCEVQSVKIKDEKITLAKSTPLPFIICYLPFPIRNRIAVKLRRTCRVYDALQLINKHLKQQT
jgi:hypothetical protein